MGGSTDTRWGKDVAEHEVMGVSDAETTVDAVEATRAGPRSRTAGFSKRRRNRGNTVSGHSPSRTDEEAAGRRAVEAVLLHYGLLETIGPASTDIANGVAT